MVQKIGIDFGTTNSLISVVTRAGKIKSFDDLGRPHPSVVRYESDKTICGTKAKDKLDQYGIGVLGNTVRGPKKLLGCSDINVDGRQLSPGEVVTEYIRYLIDHARDEDDEESADLKNAVVTIPVAMGGRERQVLREALLNAGVYVESFVHEPLAALYGYFRDQDDPKGALRRFEGKMLMVFDWGGGTLDLTLCKVVNGNILQILNRGNNSVGGDYLDDAIQKYVEQKHAEQHCWNDENQLERSPGMLAKLQNRCEVAKITLSTREETYIFVPNYYVGEGDEAEIAIKLTRNELEAISNRLVRQGIDEIEALLADDQADIDRQTIALCLATGGMVNMPCIKRQLNELFGIASLEISKKGDRIISEGAAWIASDELKLTLSKPFELLEARNSMLTIIPEGTLLPTRGNSISYPQSMYCTDPRDGNALASFKRPQMVGKTAAADPRTNYGELVIPINPDFPPLEERIELEISIDENLIVHVSGVGGDMQIPRSIEFYDLEFGLATMTVQPESKKKRLKLRGEKKLPYGLIIRANVTPDKEDWELVPGELLKAYNDEHPFLRKTLTEQQRTEFVRYQPCSNCGARWGKNCCSNS
ncbi:Hsp70 family protein [Citrobacter portucalensis]|uniref:Hsp70 family protein n=1 Tax=Citrobacter portucalensis TaxID=1639133 RepID=UPI002269CF02|nr:Hsp70 family protein [Citrobacter portucalensis]MCX8973903.1 Hsp70 family protein [Citrobacter portucalensis]MCX8983816.1 Hsp70 family protein [Citrobacter portucalensis]